MTQFVRLYPYSAQIAALRALLDGLSDVATTGSYADLSGKPTLGSAAAQNVEAFATAAQGAKADTAVQPGALGTAAAQSSGAFATAAQGATADTAVQPDDLAAVATTGDYDDLTGKPSLGTAAAQAADAFATSAQGGKADTALQPADIAPYPALLAQSPSRTGEARSLFSSALTTDPLSRPIITAGDVVVDATAGTVLRISGDDTDDITGYVDIAPRIAAPIYAGRTYLVRYHLRRNIEAADPANNAVELRWQNLNYQKNSVSNVRLGDPLLPVVDDGPITYYFLIGKAGAPGTLDYTIPPTAVYGLPHIRVFGNGQQTDIIAIDAPIDVTDIVTGTAATAVVAAGLADEIADRIADTADVRLNFAAADAVEAAARLAGDTAEAEARVAADLVQDQRSTRITSRLSPDSRRRPARVRFAVAGPDGRTPHYIDAEGITYLLGIGFINADGRRPGRYKFGITDETGAIGMYLDRDARLGAAGFDFIPSAAPRRPSRYVAGFADYDGNTALGVGHDGLTTLRFHPDAITMLADDQVIADDVAAAAWRGDLQIANVRAGSAFTRATVFDADGTIYDVAQLRTGTLTTAVAVGVLDITLSVGQSNQGGGSGDVGHSTPFQATGYPHHILSLATPGGGVATDWYGDQTYAFDTFTDFAPSVHRTNYSLAPAILHNQARVALDRRARRKTPPLGSFASWRGSYPADNFLPGAGFQLYENAIAGAVQMKANALRYGLPGAVCRRLRWTQGEAGPYPYASVFGDVIDAYVSGVRAALGQDFDPHFYFVQTNQDASSATSSGVEIDQRAVAIARLGDGVTCCGPMYQGQLFDQGSADIHLEDVGRMMVAEVEGLAAQTVEAGGTFRALGLDVSTARTGAQIDVTYSNMPGTQLLIDSDHVPNPGTLGFRAYLESDGTPLTINSAVIVGLNKVRLTLSADPGAAVRVEYAINTGSPLNQWARGRGNIYVDTGVASIFSAYGTPATIRHYALRMRIVTPS